MGKPSSLTYTFAEKRLKSYRHDLVHQAGGGQENGEQLSELKKVYMIGDNPESDIMGANNYRSPHGTEWVSVLVKTGVYRGEEEGGRYDFEARPELKPKVIVDDVKQAIDWALRDSGWQGEVDSGN